MLITEVKLTDKLIRRITQRCGGWVVDVRQRVSREGFTPEMWGPWVAWGDVYSDEHTAKAEHDNDRQSSAEPDDLCHSELHRQRELDHGFSP